MSPVQPEELRGKVIRLVLDVTECPTCRRPNEALRRADDVSWVYRRRTLTGEPHRCLQVVAS